MPGYLALPAELHARVFDDLDSSHDQRSLASACRFLRGWRARAWRRLELCTKDVKGLVKNVHSLHRTLAAIPELRGAVRGIYVRRLLDNKWDLSPEERDDHVQLDLKLACVLYLVDKLEVFVFDHFVDGCESTFTMAAVCKLPSLKSLSLGGMNALDQQSFATSLSSMQLYELYVVSSQRVDVEALFRGQKQLRRISVDVQDTSSASMAKDWVDLEHMNVGIDWDSFPNDASEVAMWYKCWDILDTALVSVTSTSSHRECSYYRLHCRHLVLFSNCEFYQLKGAPLPGT
jgi:hypothetical protein